MNAGLFNSLNTRGGVMCTDPRTLPNANTNIDLHHAMDRPPDLAFLRLTCKVADSNWLPGESFHVYPTQITAPGFLIKMVPGRVRAIVGGGNMNVLSGTDPATSGLITVTSWNVELVCVWLAPIPASQ